MTRMESRISRAPIERLMGVPETAPYIRSAVAVPPCRARLQDSAHGVAQEPRAFGRHVPCMVSNPMARSRALEKTVQETGGVWGDPRSAKVQIGDEFLELVPEKAHDVNVLRGWLGRVNGPNYPQPFLVEGPPGCFRLYVGDAAERIRTARGIQ
jgi:hypothetical protein